MSEKKTFEERYEQCKLKEDDIEKGSCLFKLLHDITRLQDNIQLAIPPINPSVQLSKEIINDANAIILNASGYKGDLRPEITSGYITEKVGYIIWHYNNMVHDYNRTINEDFVEKITHKFVPERNKPVPKEDRKKIERITFKDQNKL